MARSPAPISGNSRRLAVSSPWYCLEAISSSDCAEVITSAPAKRQSTTPDLNNNFAVFIGFPDCSEHGRPARVARYTRPLFTSSCIKAKAEALDGASAQAAGGVARGFVGGFDQHGVHLDIAFGDLKA